MVSGAAYFNMHTPHSNLPSEHKNDFKDSEVFAIKIQVTDADALPTLEYLTLRDFIKNGNTFNCGWRGIDGSPIKIFR